MTKSPRKEWHEELSLAQRQRFKFFETKLLWEGQANRQDLCRQFELSANHLTRDIREYKKALPKNIWYDEVARSYKPSSKFLPSFITGEAEEYLVHLRSYALSPTATAVLEIGSPVACDTLPLPKSNIASDVLRKLLFAVHQSSGCEVLYQSFSSPEPKKRRIWPQAMVWAGDRWHIRVFDSDRSDYIDLVLARIESVTHIKARLPKEAGDDLLWSEKVSFNIIPHPSLSSSQKKVVANEFGMVAAEGGYYWGITLRKCLIPYFLERYRLDLMYSTEASAPTYAKRLSLENVEIAKAYSFPIE